MTETGLADGPADGLADGLAEGAADPVRMIADLVGSVDSGLGAEAVRSAVERVGGGRVRRRRLATALAADPSVLTTGRSPAPRVVGELLLGLQAAGARTIARPCCAGCGRAMVAVCMRGDRWYCGTCMIRRAPCAGCGKQREVASHDRHGRPRCRACRDEDPRDPVEAITEIVTALDPALSAEAVAAAVNAITTRPADVQKLAWTLQEAPELLTGEGARASPMVGKLIDHLHQAGAVRIQRPACPSCGRVTTLGFRQNRHGGQRICRACYAATLAVACTGCGKDRPPAGRREDGAPLCRTCWNTEPVNREVCARCHRLRPVITRPCDGPLCATCTPVKTATCAVCGCDGPCKTSALTGDPVCARCRKAWAVCSRCGTKSRLRGGTRDQPLCGNCADRGTGQWKTCPACGTSRLTTGPCQICGLHQLLRELLTDPATGRIRAELGPLHQTLADTERPDSTRSWLRRPKVRELLSQLAAGQQPLSHATLDQLPPGNTLAHLRSVLVGLGSLPPRDEHLTRLEHWIAATVADRADPHQKELLNRYATWHVLRRLRDRTRSGITLPHQAATARQSIQAAGAFLDWLTAHDHTIASCPQARLDHWTCEATSTMRITTGTFLRWARANKLTSLDFPSSGHWDGPAQLNDTDTRWQQARRLLHDTSVKPEDRLAGLLVLLYAQTPTAISRLSTTHIQATSHPISLLLGPEPLALPAPLDDLVTQLAADASQRPGSWLLPGARPGQPITPQQLGARLRKLGINPRQARSTALFQLATELPAAILARMLGIHIQAAIRWQHATSGDWTTYAADISHRLTDSPHTPNRPSPTALPPATSDRNSDNPNT